MKLDTIMSGFSWIGKTCSDVAGMLGSGQREKAPEADGDLDDLMKCLA